MNATITTTRRTTKHSHRSVIYIESPLNDIADEFATKHGVFGLSFKSKTWSKVCRATNKRHVEVLRKVFPDAINIQFSNTAGCACGCSPGFIMTHAPALKSNYWVGMVASAEEREAFAAEMQRQTNALAAEVLDHKAVAA